MPANNARRGKSGTYCARAQACDTFHGHAGARHNAPEPQLPPTCTNANLTSKQSDPWLQLGRTEGQRTGLQLCRGGFRIPRHRCFGSLNCNMAIENVHLPSIQIGVCSSFAQLTLCACLIGVVCGLKQCSRAGVHSRLHLMLPVPQSGRVVRALLLGTAKKSARWQFESGQTRKRETRPVAGGFCQDVYTISPWR